MPDTTATETINVVMDVVDSSDSSFAQESSKTLITAAVSTIGVVVGAVVLAKGYEKFTEFRINRAMKKIAENVHVVTDAPETETAK